MDLATVIGLAAASCTTFSFLPQVIRSWKTKSTKDVSFPMCMLLLVGFVLWLGYGILIRELPIILANSVSLVIVLPMLVLKRMYG